MGKHKLKRFAELETFKNVMQFGLTNKINFTHKGKWATDYFKNHNPIVLELACGKGEYALGLAQINPNKNYIGIDMKGNRIWKGAKTAIEQNMNHVAFLRTYIEWLHEFFAEGEVEEIWITFSDPFLSTTKAQKRLTSPRYLEIYSKILKPGSTINLKTDDDTLFQYTLDVLEGKEAIEKYPCDVSRFKLQESRNDIYNDGKAVNEALQIKTYYEQKHLQIGKKIKYVKMQFQPS
ncbi:MAG: tRNA ((46)-N7)-methyltransferase TrmB [Bacteroidota bacterium]|jgi:tRNA (guanine-N7-)-methyltransferase